MRKCNESRISEGSQEGAKKKSTQTRLAAYGVKNQLGCFSKRKGFREGERKDASQTSREPQQEEIKTYG